MNRANINTVNNQKQIERDIWQKLVVKILKWKDELLCTQQVEKITREEWDFYVAEMIKIDQTYKKQASEEKISSLNAIITKHGGFQD